MNFDRVALKQRGKAAFKRNYWKCVLVAFLLGLLTSATTGSASSGTDSEELTDSVSGYMSSEDTAYLLVALGIIAVVVFVMWVIYSLLKIFLFNPLRVGGYHFFVRNAYDQTASPRLLGLAFQGGRYGSTVLTMFLMSLFTTLWSLLFIIPGIVKHYEYLMIPYLLADNPEMTHSEAFRISREMMTGNKWNAFVLDLSFVGWELLAACTFGILNIFYVNPYYQATQAELYLTLRSRSI